MPLEELYRFQQLKEAKVVDSWAQLRVMIRDYGFPPGRLLSPHIRVWTHSEVTEYLANRPVEPAPAVNTRTEKSVRVRRAQGFFGRKVERPVIPEPQAA